MTRDPDIREEVTLLLAKAHEILGDSAGLDQIADPAILKEEIERRQRIEMKAVIDASNRFVQSHGLPLERYRVF